MSKGPGTRDETPDETADRNWGDLLQELRVTQTGVQILFSLLLTVPFSARFDKTTPFQRTVYAATLLLAAAAVVVLVTPAAYHRLLFGSNDKERVVEVSGRLAVVGLLLLALAVNGVLLLVFDVLYGRPGSLAVGAAGLVATLVMFFGLAARRSATRPRDPADRD